jgi:hypothetical protein
MNTNVTTAHRGSGLSPRWYAEVPHESTLISIFRFDATSFKTASPIGERQILPRQTIRTDSAMVSKLDTLSK